jgi:magnesium chelatase subunit D
MTTGANPVWARAQLALQMITADPQGLGGIVLRARSGPVRDAFMAMLPATARRIHPSIQDDQLFGGIDINATLANGTVVQTQGLAAHKGLLVLGMAERATPALAARLARLLDSSASTAIIALDEGIEDEAPPLTLSDRLAFHVDLSSLTHRDLASLETDLSITPPPARLAERDIEQIAHVAQAFGVTSLRAGCFAMRAAQINAALAGRDRVESDDIEAAIALVLIPRATQLPQTEDTAPDEGTPPPETGDDTDQGSAEQDDRLPDDMLIEAAKAMLPPDFLDHLAQKHQRNGAGSGSGAAKSGNRRGRPLPSRPGRLGGQARLDLIASLRAAAPWQRIRRTLQPDRGGVIIHPTDIHLRRYDEKSDRLLIFVVDASGSAALTRLAEAKGAVELMLAAAYARRDHVSLIAFRGDNADVLLAPTRSLARTKRELAGLPGGGATPLALGLKQALTLVEMARKKGMLPTIALLTDGRANIALDGTPNRTQAGADATTMAQHLRLSGADAVVIDMGRRPERQLADLARVMGGTYLALPMANANAISTAVSAALDG